MTNVKGPFFFITRSGPPEVFSGKCVLKICSKYREYQCRSAILMKLQNSFIEIALRHGCSSVNLLHISRTPFYKSTSGRLFLHNQSFGRSRESLEGETLYSSPFNLRYFNPVRSFKLRWCRARDLSGSQIPVTTGGFERRIFCI